MYKKLFRRLAVLFMAVVMLLPMTSLQAKAAEEKAYEYTKPYVVSFNNAGLIPEKYAGYMALWQSPHRSTFYNINSGEEEGGVSSVIFLYNLEEEEVIPVYCLDLPVGGVKGSFYQRLNLEDSGYFSSEAAQRLRAVMNKSFPKNADISAIESEANTWLAAQGKGQLRNLTGAEVVSATQYVIWSLANAEDGYRGNKAYAQTAYKPNWAFSVMYPGPTAVTDKNASVKAENAAAPENQLVDMLEKARVDEETQENITASNINLLAEYYLNLSPEAARKTVISDASMKDVQLSLEEQEDGTYKASASLNVNADIDSGDALTLTLKYKTFSKTVALTQSGAQSITLEGLPEDAKEDVLTLEINGYQEAADVYMFETEGGRWRSQTMIGWDDSRLPVHSELRISEKERILSITKTTLVKEGDVETPYPLEGITFDIYYVCSVNDFNDNYDSYKEITTQGKTLLGTVTTDIAGKAVFNITQAGGADGVYLLAEREHPAIKNPIMSYVAVPETSEDGSSLNYNVMVYPKNDVIGGPDIDKNVTEIGNTQDSVDVGKEHTWILRGGITKDIATGKSYVISDELDERLTFKGGVEVKIAASDAKAHEEPEANTLTEGKDYIVTLYKDGVALGKDAEAEEADKFTVSLTASGMAKAEMLSGKKFDEFEVRVYFNTVINSKAAMGSLIPNQATVDYTNGVNFSFHAESDEATVYTCGVNLLKVDAKDTSQTLAGAQFKLARVATAEEIADENIATSKLVTGLFKSEEVVYVTFHGAADLQGEKTDTVETDANGKAVFYGLEEGSYYLVEVKAPAGYNLLSYPIKVELNNLSHEAENTITVKNSNSFQLPSTGGMGTMIFTAGGALLAAGAGAVLVLKKKKEEE